MKRRISALVVAVMLIAGSSAAVASATVAITASPGGDITATSIGTFTFTSPTSTLTCPVELSGIVPQRIEKSTNRTFVTFDDRVQLSCNRAGQTPIGIEFLVTGATPISGTYNGILGTLPGIDAIRVTWNNVALLLSIPGISSFCLYSGQLSALHFVNSGNIIVTGSLALSRRLPTSTINCFGPLRVSGTLAVTPAQTYALSNT